MPNDVTGSAFDTLAGVGEPEEQHTPRMGGAALGRIRTGDEDEKKPLVLFHVFFKCSSVRDQNGCIC
ncbi:hypothetical protein JTE90_020649 [Oedothorax gibbosus]|uniref:Uncharacterized protein n=1 Tax=Oedothorax gibbosus TaxID=931172 RepID=A0AAV6UTQ1_9ARAC|nr:hypothetical protein JTE90_020649 [Oedothorax gibbosus]